MSASSVGRRVIAAAAAPVAVEAPATANLFAAEDVAAPSAPAAPTPASVQQDAKAAIVGAIPTEGFATYLGIYALVLALVVDKHGHPLAWAAFAAVGVGAAINILALLWAAGLSWKATPPAKPGRAVLSLAWRVIAFTILFGVLILATPENPFATFAGVNVGFGLIAVVIAGAVIAITKKP